MRINLNKRGIMAGLFIALTVLSLVFLLFGGEDAGRRKGTRPLSPEEAGLLTVAANNVINAMPVRPVVSVDTPASAPATDSSVTDQQPAHTTRQPLAVPPDGSGQQHGPFTLGQAAGKAAALADICRQILADIAQAGSACGAPNGNSLLVSPEGHVFEESLSPGLADHIVQVDFALAQSLRRLNLPDNHLVLDADELRDEQGAYYHHKTVRIYAGEDLPLYRQTLRETLGAWAESAKLTPGAKGADDAVWNVILEGVVTHTLYLYPGSPPDGGLTVQPPAGEPRMVIVLDDMGESVRHARFLLGLDYPVTFAVWPRSSHASEVAALAERGGAEIIIHQPMQPVAYPEVKPGPGAMFESMSDAELLAVLRRNFELVPQAVGLNNHMGSLLTQDERAMRLVSGELRQRGLIGLDSLTHARSVFGRVAAASGVTTYRRDIFLDVDPDKEAVLAQLRKAERIALLKGQSIAIGHPLPGTLDALKEWQCQRNLQVQLVKLRDLRPLGR